VHEDEYAAFVERYTHAKVEVLARKPVRVPFRPPQLYMDCLGIKHGCPRCGAVYVNPLTPNDPYRGRTSPLTSKR